MTQTAPVDGDDSAAGECDRAAAGMGRPQVSSGLSDCQGNGASAGDAGA